MGWRRRRFEEEQGRDGPPGSPGLKRRSKTWGMTPLREEGSASAASGPSLGVEGADGDTGSAADVSIGALSAREGHQPPSVGSERPASATTPSAAEAAEPGSSSRGGLGATASSAGSASTEPPSTAGTAPPAAAASTSATRSFLPWKSNRGVAGQARRRDLSHDTADEEAQPQSRDVSTDARGEGRVGRAKEKEPSSWSSFLRRAKSRDGSAPRRPRTSSQRANARGAVQLEADARGGAAAGSAGLAAAAGDVALRGGAQSVAPPSALSADTEGEGGDGKVPSALEMSTRTVGEEWQGAPTDDGAAAGTRRPPFTNASGVGLGGFPFLRAPWKRSESAAASRSDSVARSCNSPSKAASPTSGAAPLAATSVTVVSAASAASSVPVLEPAGAASAVPAPVPATSLDGGKSDAVKKETEKADAKDPKNPVSDTVEQCESVGGSEEVSEENVEEQAEENEDNLPDEEKALLQWERYRARNRSLVVDIFEGQLRSQLTCLQCGASSSTFEPFRYLSVPIPSNHMDHATLRIVFFPLPLVRGEERPALSRYSVTVPKSSTVQKVEKSLSRLLPVAMSSVLLAEVYRSRIHRYLDSALPLSDVRAEDQLFAFEVLQSPAELMQYQESHAPSRRREKPEEQKKPSQPRVLLIQAMHRRVVDVCRSDGRTWAQRREVFGLPFVMSAASTWTYATLHDMLMLHARRFLRPPRKSAGRSSSSSAGSFGAMSGSGFAVGGYGAACDVPAAPAGTEDRAAQMPFVARIVNASGTACGACDRRNCTGCLLPKGNARLRLRAGLLTGAVSTAKIYLALDWVDSAVYDQEYLDSVRDQVSTLLPGEEREEAEEDVGNGSRRASGSGSVPISACIDAFAQPEDLKKEFGNGIKCEKCGEVVDAVKKLEIWREPDVLILHIKRFHFSGVHYEKLSTPVEVPYRELSLRPWIVGPSGTSAAPYELFAVTCHHGGMSGGHYISYCSNTEGKEPVWLKFNDESVTGVSIGSEVDEISRQCYVLFYRKRAFSSSNLINYASLI
eukprot:TRINITY_DN4142_c0_g6_i1.p1 TRINITY_DN4142_c0_g6~~TRINITY_DN4142_c0_g6_i1.p1  ORF type:complete len:1022 (-),score=206.69 TRINITY_DN4142_c0_g6_i1:127-3192(-)